MADWNWDSKVWTASATDRSTDPVSPSFQTWTCRARYTLPILCAYAYPPSRGASKIDSTWHSKCLCRVAWVRGNPTIRIEFDFGVLDIAGTGKKWWLVGTTNEKAIVSRACPLSHVQIFRGGYSRWCRLVPMAQEVYTMSWGVRLSPSPSPSSPPPPPIRRGETRIRGLPFDAFSRDAF